MRNAPLIFLVFVSLLLSACKKDIFSNGPTIEEDRIIEGAFRTIELKDNVDVNLVHQEEGNPQNHTRIHITTGENLMSKIRTEIHGDTLTISNENRFNWLRPYDYPLEITVAYDSIQTIIFNSNGDLNTDSIPGVMANDEGNALSTVYLFVEGGSGDINLSVQCQRLYTNYQFGTASVTLNGDARIAYTSTSYNCHGPIKAQTLETNIHYIYAYGTNNITVKAFHEINANNHNNGSVYYLTYIGQTWSNYSQSYVDIDCPEVVTAYGNNIYPLDPDQ